MKHAVRSSTLLLFLCVYVNGAHAQNARESRAEFDGPVSVEAVVEYALNQTSSEAEKPRVRRQVKQLYFEIWRLNTTLETRHAQQSLLESVIKILEGQFRIGKARQEDVLAAQLHLSGMAMSIVEVQQMQIAVVARLAAILNLRRDRVPAVADLIAPTDVPKFADVLVAIMDRCRPKLPNRRHVQGEVEALHAEIQKHDAMLNILENDMLPKSEQVVKLLTQRLKLGEAVHKQLFESLHVLFRYRLDVHKHRAAREQAIAALEFQVGCPASSWETDDPRRGDAKPPSR